MTHPTDAELRTRRGCIWLTLACLAFWVAVACLVREVLA